MTVVISRADFERLIALRMDEAKKLLDLQNWDGARYLVGYAVEFALKIRIISRQILTDGFPDKRLTDVFFRHDLLALCRAAGLEDELEADTVVNLQWDTVKTWSEQSRYQIGRAAQDALDLYDAIENGVLPWIRTRW